MKPAMQPLDVVIAATFTCNPVATLFSHAADGHGLSVSIEQAPYGQVVEQLLDPAAAFRRNAGGLNVCLIRPGDWTPASAGAADRRATLRVFTEVAADFAAATTGHLLVCVCPDQPDDPVVPADRDLLDDLVADLGNLPGVAVVSAIDWFTAYGVADPFDPHADELARLPFTDTAFAAIAIGLARVARSLTARPRKVIAVDCDYTLWGGACGDVEPAELVIDDRYRAVHRFLRERYELGFMLAICSRNDPVNVERAFAARADDLGIGAEHFVAREVGWEPKSAGLTRLAAQLGVGVDSFVLLDDDPIVCAEVEAFLPAVGVVHLPPDADPATVLGQRGEFDRFFATDEDRRRNDTYRADTLRVHEAEGVQGYAELNRRLATVIEVHRADRPHWRRVEQLVSRTNQFTCGTRRPGEVVAALRAGATGWVATLRDRFGEYGVVAAAVAAKDRGDGFELDTFAMSCRVLNRGVAEALLGAVTGAVTAAGHRELRVRLRQTGRNHLAVSFFTERAADRRTDGDDLLLMIASPDSDRLRADRLREVR